MKDNKEQLHHDLFMVSRMIYGNWMQQVTYAFAELGIADCLKHEAKSAEMISSKLNLHSSYFTRMMRCACELGYVSYDKTTARFILEPRGELLGSSHPNSMRNEARLNGADYRYLPWSNLVNILKTGIKEEYSPTIKDGSLEYLSDKPELLEVFHEAMHNISEVENVKLIKDFDFSSYETVMDIGCGRGSFLETILEENKHLKGVMFDIEGAFEAEEDVQLGGRLQKMTGDFFEEIPDNADCYTMKNVIHNWREFKTKNLLNKVREAMQSEKGSSIAPSEKRLLVIENIIPDDGSPHMSTWMDLNFMILIDGAEQTAEGYEQLGQDCGFKLEAIHPTETGRHIIEFSLI
jgi:hypothetical protein